MRTVYNVETGSRDSHKIIATCDSRKLAEEVVKKYNENPIKYKYHRDASIVETNLFEYGDKARVYRLWTASAYINIDGTVSPIDRGYSIGKWNFEDNFKMPPEDVKIEKWGRDSNGNVKIYMRSNTRKKVRDYLKELSKMNKTQLAKIGIYVR